ncbi:hypothetical protein Tco_0009647 [Tanacetum coccineum]
MDTRNPPATSFSLTRVTEEIKNSDGAAGGSATKAEADIYKKLAYSHNIIFKIMNPATGIADEVLGASVLKRYREDLHESKEMMVTASGVADEELGAFVLKRHSRM